MTISGTLTLVPRDTKNEDHSPDNGEQNTQCTFTLDDSALTWQPAEAAGKRDGRFLLLDTLKITREGPETFTLLCEDGEQFTVLAPSENECAMWFRAISRGICEARGEEYEEQDDENDFVGPSFQVSVETPTQQPSDAIQQQEEEEEEDDHPDNRIVTDDDFGLTFIGAAVEKKVCKEIQSPEDLKVL